MNYYDSIASGYEELHREEQLKKLSIIRKKISLKKDYKLLDVGCGTGLSSDFDCDVYGIDPSRRLLEIAKKKPIKIFFGYAEQLPFPDNFFDVVISLTAIQNFGDISKALDEIKRVGKDQFALSFLKKSPKRELIERLIEEKFYIIERIDESKDIIFIAKKIKS
jgi:ubiquinone/menaquinone biosynthesis C-methylase UbiE